MRGLRHSRHDDDHWRDIEMELTMQSEPEPTPRRVSVARPHIAIAASVLSMVLLTGLLSSVAASDVRTLVPVIVRGVAGSLDSAERLVLQAGGRPGRPMSIIDGF